MKRRVTRALSPPLSVLAIRGYVLCLVVAYALDRAKARTQNLTVAGMVKTGAGILSLSLERYRARIGVP